MPLIFIKLGGSLITDKRQRATARPRLLKRLARELQAAREALPDLQILLGHGSGSFGHWEASRYQTRAGVETAAQWQGFAEVSAAALRLNRLVVDAFINAGVPVLSLQPAASVLAEGGRIVTLAHKPIQRALDAELIPTIFGDVAFDRELGGTILSTEDLFVHLAPLLQPQRILLLGNAPGVLDDQRQVIPCITPGSYPQFEPFLRGSGYVDVTGGMADKVERMVTLVNQLPGLRIWILSGHEPDALSRALLDPDGISGTCITAD